MPVFFLGDDVNEVSGCAIPIKTVPEALAHHQRLSCTPQVLQLTGEVVHGISETTQACRYAYFSGAYDDVSL
jgi:hypothetical protein